MTDLTVSLAGVILSNPTVLASGILGVTASGAGLAVAGGAGAIALKSCGPEPRSGHPGPAILPVRGGLLNAVGLSNPGAANVAAEIRVFKERFQAPVIASIFAPTEALFAAVAEQVLEGAPDLLEVNVSCPNVESEFGVPFGLDHRTTERITRNVKAVSGRTPVLIKLSPQAHRIGELARRCEGAGADGITAINTVGPGMAIDVATRRPVLSNRFGGLSGPAILPIAVRCVYEIASAVTIPVVGTGGVSCAEDALQMVLAGATAVGIGTAVATAGVGVFQQIADGMSRYLSDNGFDSLDAIRGAAHER